MRNRLVALSAVLAFAVGVAAVAVVAGSGGDGQGRLEKLSFAFAGGQRSSMALGAPAAYPQFGPLEYKVPGDLPELAGEAPAYRLGDQTMNEEVSELASRLGLSGDVERIGSGWTVRDEERELSVSRAPGLPWYLFRRCLDTSTTPTSAPPSDAVVSSGCAYGSVGMIGGGSWAPAPVTAQPPTRVATRTAAARPAPAPPTSAVAPCRGSTADCAPAAEAPTTSAAPPCPPGASCDSSEAHSLPGGEPYPPTPALRRPPDLPAKAEAERMARSFFTALGVDLDRFELRDEFLEWRAVVQPRVAAMPTVGWGFTVSVGSKGRITRASGFLAEPDRIGDYPLAGTTKALERLRAGEGTAPNPVGGTMDSGSATVGPDCPEATEICDPPAPVTTIPGSDPSRSTTPTMVIQPPTTAMVRPANQASTPMTTLACSPDAECMAPTAPAPPPPLPIRPPVLTISGVHLALEYVGPALVPVYVFELEGGGAMMPVPAVTDRWIEENGQGGPEVGPGGDRPVPGPMPMPSVVTTVPVPPAGAERGSVTTRVEEVPAAKP